MQRVWAKAFVISAHFEDDTQGHGEEHWEANPLQISEILVGRRWYIA